MTVFIRPFINPSILHTSGKVLSTARHSRTHRKLGAVDGLAAHAVAVREVAALHRHCARLSSRAGTGPAVKGSGSHLVVIGAATLSLMVIISESRKHSRPAGILMQPSDAVHRRNLCP